MADTVQNVIDRARARLLSGSEQLNQLAAPYTAGSGVLAFADSIEAISHNARLSSGLNVFQVRTPNKVGLTATVWAGQEGSTDVSLPSGALIRVNPRFTDFALFQELNFDLADLSGRGLFQIKVFEFPWTSAAQGYDLTGVTMIAPYAVRQHQPDTASRWNYLVKDLDWRVEFNANLTAFPSGTALRIFPQLHTGHTVQFLYKAPLTSLTAVGDLISTSGLPATAGDLPELGITYRLLPQRDAKRNFTEAQPNPRRTEQVASGAILRTAAVLNTIREDRIRTEVARLRAKYPDRRV